MKNQDGVMNCLPGGAPAKGEILVLDGSFHGKVTRI